MTCPSCQTELPEQLTECFACGQDLQKQQLVIGMPPHPFAPIESPTLNAEYFARQEKLRVQWLRYFEGFGLERGGDLTSAMAIYEELAATKFAYPAPFERLAIIYRRAGKPADEERVVRLALAAIGASRKQSWFSERLAKLLVARGVRELTK